MKCRTGFVSNSSSSSFIILKKYLKPCQLEKIVNHYNYIPEEDREDAWRIDENEDTLECSTDMDNFDLYNYIGELGVPIKAVKGGWYES